MRWPSWVTIEGGARVHSTVEFVPYEGMETIIRKGAFLDSGAKIHGGVDVGEDCIVGHYSVIRPNSKVGTHTIIGNLTMLEGDVEVGHHTTIHSQCHLARPTIVGNYVFMGPLSGTTNDRVMHHYRGVYSRKTLAHFKEYSEPVVIKDAVQIGEGTTILAGVVINTHAKIGMGSNVTKDVPPYALALGNPARVVKYIDRKDDIIILCKDHPYMGLFK